MSQQCTFRAWELDSQVSVRSEREGEQAALPASTESVDLSCSTSNFKP